MKFRGNYSIIGTLDTKDLESPKGQIEDFVVGTSVVVNKGSLVDMKTNQVKNVGSPTEDFDAVPKKFLVDSLMNVNIRNVLPDFSTEVIPGKDNDLLLVGNAPGQIVCADPKVAGKAISDIECALTDGTVYAMVQDALNSVIVSKDGGRIWTYLASLPGGLPSDPALLDSTFNFHYMSSTSNKKLVAWRKKMSASARPAMSKDGGKTWNAVTMPDIATVPATAEWIPARLTKPADGPVFLVNTTTNNKTHFIYKYDTITETATRETVSVTPTSKVVSAASDGERLIMITSAGETLVRNGNNLYALGGTLPQTGVVWNDIVATGDGLWIACSGAGGTKSYIATSTNYGASWTGKEVSSANVSLSGINFNRNAGPNGTIIVTGANTALVSTDGAVTWKGTVNYKIPSSQNITPVGAGFIVASNTSNFEIIYDGLNWISVIDGVYSDIFFKTPTGWSKYVPNFNGDAYLERAGGILTGTVSLTGAAKITGIQMPVAPTDVASKDYVDKKTQGQSRRGIMPSATAFNAAVRITPTIETVKLTIVGKGTDAAKAGRYYSEMVIVIDPLNLVSDKIQAESTEYAVISTGDLQLTASIPSVAKNAQYIDVSFTANRACTLEVIVEIIDLETDGTVVISGEQTV